MRCFKLNHEPSKNEIIWYVIDNGKIYWIETNGYFHQSYEENMESLITKYDYTEVSEEEFNKYLLAKKLSK